ncbi:MAG: metallophosphoesterase, partial [Bacteroidetes bacterium]|nr:metallophosphoesterase [Bacteroidota bacterium]
MKSILILLIFGLSINQVYTQTKFAVIGDYGYSSSAEADISDMIDTWNVDFIITLGDNNYNNGSASTIDKNIGRDYNQWIYPYVGSYPPGGSPDNINRFFPSLGNHDYNTANAQPYIDYFTLPNNERWYTFSWGNVDFYVLDSKLAYDEQIRQEQIAWLENETSNSTADWKIVYFHYPPYSSRFGAIPMRFDFNSMDIDMVLSGHDHLYERLEIDGLTYIINGLGGKSIYDTSPPISGSIIQYNGDFGAMLVETTGSTLTSKFYNRNGNLIDTWTKNNSASPPELLIAAINTLTEVTLYFSKPLDPLTSQNASNYNIDNSISVISAALSSNNRDITLTTSEHTPNQQYTVTVSNVTDLSGNTIDPQANSAQYFFEVDTTPPQLFSAFAIVPTQVTLFFSEALDSQSAQNVSNYNINNGISIIDAVLNSNNTDVTLTTSAHDTNQTYTATVSN